jgi:hypothetical protein
MKATFDGLELSPGTYAPDVTWNLRMVIRGEQPVQVSRPARAEYARVYARGGRLHTLDLFFKPPAAADTHEAFAALALFFTTLSQQGDLVIESGGNQITYPDACLVAFTPPARVGVSNEFPLQFVFGEPSALVLLILDELGAVLEDETGTELEY